MPDGRTEAARDLSRALEDARDDLQRARQRMSKFLLRRGPVFDETTPAGRRRSNWTEAYRRWARSIEFGEADDAAAHGRYMDAVERCAEAERELERKVEEAASRPEWEPVVDALCLVKGIDVASAFLLAAEAGDFSRFPERAVVRRVVRPGPLGALKARPVARRDHPRGQLPRAARARRGVLARPDVDEAPQEAEAGPRGRAGRVEARREARPPPADRRDAMSQAGKRPCVANCATAREMACWVWAIALMAR